MDKNRCCVAILEDRDELDAARRVLALKQNVDVSISWFCKPGTGKEEERSIEFSDIGTIKVGGSVGEGSAQRRLEPSCEFRWFSDLLCDIGVPESRHRVYEKILNEGHTLIILQGSESDLRYGCDALSPLCQEKPILYFR